MFWFVCLFFVFVFQFIDYFNRCQCIIGIYYAIYRVCFCIVLFLFFCFLFLILFCFCYVCFCFCFVSFLFFSFFLVFCFVFLFKKTLDGHFFYVFVVLKCPVWCKLSRPNTALCGSSCWSSCGVPSAYPHITPTCSSYSSTALYETYETG